MGEQNHPDSRDSGLDFTKGVLVLFMVLYHWMNYFVGIEGPVYPYLRFIPPSFIFISGFLLVNIYPSRYGLSNPKLYIRLLIRGLKILALFTVLNVVANMVVSKSYKGAMPGVEAFISNAAAIYIWGNGRMSFGVLVPISYLLIFSTLIFLGMQVTKYAPFVVCAASFICVALLDYYAMSSPNLSFIAVGILGMLLGQYPLPTIANWARHPYVVALLNAGYIMGIVICGERYFLQVISVPLSVMLIYTTGVRSIVFGPLQETLALLGRYSLFGYIAQIAVLQVLHRSIAILPMNNWLVWPLSFGGAVALTILMVMLTDKLRAISSAADKMYTLVFA